MRTSPARRISTPGGACHPCAAMVSHGASALPCIRPPTAPPPGTCPRQNRTPARVAGVPQGGSDVHGNKGEQGGTGEEQNRGARGGGGWAVPPPLRSLHQRRRSLGWSLSRVLWALCRRSPWRPLVASGGSKPPAGDTVRTGGGRSCTVRVRCGCLAGAPVSLRSSGPSPWPGGRCREFIARALLRKGEPERGQERWGNGTPHVHRIREGSRGVPLPPGTCRAARGGCLRAPRPIRLPVPLRHSSVAPEGEGGDRRDRRVAAVSRIRGIRLGLALCEGQRCHALRGNKHRACQTVKINIFSILSFFEKMCRL